MLKLIHSTSRDDTGSLLTVKWPLHDSLLLSVGEVCILFPLTCNSDNINSNEKWQAQISYVLLDATTL